jgi:AcrR family transcriptional regulator
VSDPRVASATVVTATPALALDGRPLGKRGAATRRRLLEATAARLATNGVRDLRVVDIAREVGTSPATFYQYFRDVDEAVLALAEAVGDDLAPVGELIAQPWDGDSGLERAREVVDRFLDYWDGHQAVLRTRNLAAQEGDERFRAVRIQALGPLTERLAAKIGDAQQDGRVDRAISSYAAAAALVAMLERMGAFHVDLEAYGVTRDDMVETVARMICQTVTGS